MSKRAVAWCRSESCNSKDLTQQNQVLSTYCREKEIKVVKTITEYGTADILKLRNFRQMAKYDEFDILLMTSLDIFGFTPDIVTEEIKYLTENGVKVVTIEEGEITLDKLPELFRRRFKVVTRV